MSFYRTLLQPALFSMDPELVHHLAVHAFRLGGPLLRPIQPAADPRLARTVFGVQFPNPVGLAAGFDKSALALDAWAAFGFGFAELGTITALKQPGNEKPRIFRLPEDRALINRLGFNNDGSELIASRLAARRAKGRWPKIPLGFNLGKSKAAPLESAATDYLASFERLQEYADYVVLNVSSPNTPGLRTLQDGPALNTLTGAIQSRNAAQKPLLVKVAPDLNERALEEILELAHAHHLAGIIATNTTIDQGAVPAQLRRPGGLSGAPLRARSTEVVRFLAERTQLPIIAVGGIMSADDALEKFDAGASLVQLYTGFIYEGPGLIRAICKALLTRAESAPAAFPAAMEPPAEVPPSDEASQRSDAVPEPAEPEPAKSLTAELAPVSLAPPEPRDAAAVQEELELPLSTISQEPSGVVEQAEDTPAAQEREEEKVDLVRSEPAPPASAEAPSPEAASASRPRRARRSR